MRAFVVFAVFVCSAATVAQPAVVVDDEGVADDADDEADAVEDAASASAEAGPAVDDSVKVAPPAGVSASPFAGDGETTTEGAVVNLTGIDIVDRVYFREDTFLGFVRSKVGEAISVEAL